MTILQWQMGMTELSLVYICLFTTLAMPSNYVKIIARYIMTVIIYLYSLLWLNFIVAQKQSQLSKVEMNRTDKQRDKVRDK